MLAAPGPQFRPSLLPPLARAKHLPSFQPSGLSILACVCVWLDFRSSRPCFIGTLDPFESSQVPGSPGSLSLLISEISCFYQLKDDVILICWSQSFNGIGVQRRLP